MSQQITPKATAIRRIIAFLYDLLLIVPLMMVTVLIWLPLNQGIAIEPGNPLYPLMIITSAILTPTAFYTYFWYKGGQTLGMHSWRLKVVTMNGNPLTLKKSFTRATLFILSLTIIYLGLKSIYWSQFSITSVLLMILSLFALCGFMMAFLSSRTSVIDRTTKTYIVQLPKNKR